MHGGRKPASLRVLLPLAALVLLVLAGSYLDSNGIVPIGRLIDTFSIQAGVTGHVLFTRPLFGPKELFDQDRQVVGGDGNAVYRQIGGSKLFSATVYGGPRAFVDETGKWREIDNDLKSSRKTGFNFEARNVYNAFFARTSTKEFARFEYEGKSLEFRPLNPRVTSASTSKNTISYWNIYTDTDINYYIETSRLKEYIVVKSANAPNVFRFVLSVDGVRPKLETDGRIGFYDNLSAAPLWVFETPYMVDKAGARSNEVRYTLSNVGGKYLVEIVADAEWLKSKDRVYPIHIDPTTSLQPGSEGKDTYVVSTSPNTEAGSAVFVYVIDWTTSSQKAYTFIEFDLAGWNSLTQIHDAVLGFYQLSSASTLVQNVTLRNVNASWVESVNWDTQPTVNETIDNWSIAGGPAPQKHWLYWNVTERVKYWINGTTPNYGVRLSQNVTRDEDGSQFASSDNTNASIRPVLNITYTNVTGVAPKWFTNSTNASGIPGQNVNFRLYWTDDEELSTAVFAFDNGTGSFVNDSAVSLVEINNATTNLSGLQALYHFNNDNIDYSGNTNHLNATKLSTNASGRFGGGYGFNATAGNYLAAPNSSSLTSPTTNLTVMAWVYLNESSASQESNARIVSKEYDSLAPYVSYTLEANSASGGKFAFEMNTGGSLTTLASTTTPSAGQWYHLAGVYNGTHMVIYVNGSKEAQTPKTGAIAYSTWPLNVGGDALRNIEWFNGTVDEVAIFNRTLSAAEVEDAWNYTASWANFTKGVASSTATIRWYEWANDTYGYGNTSEAFSFDVTDNPPRYGNFSNSVTNASRLNSTGVFNGTASNDSHAVYVSWWAGNQSFKQNGSGTYFSEALPLNRSKTSSLLNLSWDWFEAANAGNLTAGTAGDSLPWQGAVLSMHFEKDAKDSSKYNNSPMLTGNTSSAAYDADCVTGGCFRLDGADDYLLSSPAAPSLNLGGASFTVSAWIKTTNSSNQFVFEREATTHVANALIAISIDCPAGKAGFSMRGDLDDPTRITLCTNESVADGAWHHLVGTRDKTGGIVSLYLNGARLYTESDSAIVLPNNGSLLIGAHNDAANQAPFDGFIDEIHVFNRSLSQGEVTALYGYEAAGSHVHNFTNVSMRVRTKDYSFNATSLVAWWDLGDSSDNETEFNKTLDLSGNGNDLSFRNLSAGGLPTLNATGIIGNSIYFNGSANQSLQTLNTTIIGNYSPAFAINAWIRMDTPQSNTPRRIFPIYAESNVPASEVRHLFDINVNNKVNFDNYPPSDPSIAGATTVTTNEWHMVSYVRANATWEAVYLDGAIDQSNTDIQEYASSTEPASAFVGQDQFASSSYNANGSIDEIMIWNRSVSSAEIAALYNNGCPTCSGGQTANWSNWSVEAYNNTQWNTSVPPGRIFQFKANFSSPIAGANYSAFLYNVDYAYGGYGAQVNQTRAGQATSFTVNWSDDLGLSAYIMAIDNGNGSFYNLSPISFSGLANFSANNYTINASPLTTIRWRVWANDSNNQGNTTQTYSFTATAASSSVSSCSNLDLADNIYNLTSNVSSGSTCFVVAANNVTLDCKGNAIFFGSGYGVQNDGYNDTTVFNCSIIQNYSSAVQSAGIFISNYSYRFNASNNYLNTSNQSLWLNWSINSNVSWNNLSSNESDTLQLNASNGSSILRNIVTANYSNRSAVLMGDPQANNSIHYNNITVKGNTTYSFGIQFSGPYGNHSASNNLLDVNGTAFAFINAANGSLWDNDANFSCAGFASQSNGANDTQFTNGSFTFFESDACDGSELDTYTGGSSNLSFINVTLNNASFSTASYDNLSVWWYMDVNVTNEASAPLSGITVSIRNATAGALGARMVIATTAANGTIGNRLVQEFQGGAVSFINSTPHNITSNSSTAANSTNFSIDYSGMRLVIIGAANAAPSTSAVTITPSSVNATKELNCSAVVSDADTATGLSVEFTWWRNDLPNSTFDATLTGLPTGATAYTSSNVTPIEKAQDWICSARGYDGSAYGDWVNSTTRTVDNAPPIVFAPTCGTDPVDLDPGFARGVGPTNVSCWAVAQDADGYADISTGMGAFYNVTTTPEGADDANVRYTNTSCVFENAGGSQLRVNCTFSLKYYAAPGIWTFRVNATDGGDASDSNSVNDTVSTLIAIGALPSTIPYGSLLPGQTSSAQHVVVTNWGNVQIDMKQEATNLTYFSSESAGCCYYNITPDSLGYSTDSGMAGKTTLPWVGEGSFDAAYNLAKTTSETEQNQSHYYDLETPLGIPGGAYEGTLTIYAQQG
ncbi:hypothetical protein AUJ14_06190 [Candidatus Micrarchaeota archaeon CG1_02_55_22]|nr:MAG: hypothetical protein AUJ14_06190 [Candidatus Micrarchaeota archaeon CG1_02_55_22]